MLLTIIITISALGLLLLLLGLRRLWGRKLVSGSLQGLFGLLFIAVALLSWSIATNLYTYHRLTHETRIAQLRFEQLSPQHYRVYVISPDNQAQSFDIRGDEWQLDAKVLKWRGIATLLGMETGYRLDRISGRYRILQQERRSPRTVHLIPHEKGLDVWSLARKHKRWLPWVDAIYGSATYMPMAHQAEFSVALTSSGLIARADNEIARQALQQWP